MNRYSAVLFDLDGTILDSAPGVFHCFEHTFRMMHREPPSRNQLWPHLGPPLPETFEHAFGFTGDDLDRAVAIYRAEYLATGAVTATLFDGVMDVVRDVRLANIPVGIATSKVEAGVARVFDHFGLTDEFDVISAASADHRRSIKADVVRHALDLLRDAGADTSRVVLVGDRIHDVEGAASAGIPSVLVGWGYGTQEERMLATASVNTPAELRAHLGV